MTVSWYCLPFKRWKSGAGAGATHAPAAPFGTRPPAPAVPEPVTVTLPVGEPAPGGPLMTPVQAPRSPTQAANTGAANDRARWVWLTLTQSSSPRLP